MAVVYTMCHPAAVNHITLHATHTKVQLSAVVRLALAAFLRHLWAVVEMAAASAK